MAYEQRLGVFAAIMNPEREILLLHRTDWDMWCLPGGFLEFGESLLSGVKRECKEELGVDIEVSELLGVYSAPERHIFRFRDGRTVHYITLVFYAMILSGSPSSISSESREVKFCSKETLPKLVPSHRIWIEDAFTHPSQPYIR